MPAVFFPLRTSATRSNPSSIRRVPALAGCVAGLLALGAAAWGVIGGPVRRGAAAEPSAVRSTSAAVRPLWTTSKIRGTPDPAPPYRTEAAFPHLKFDEPLNVSTAPGDPRLFVAERRGKVYAFANDPSVREKTLILDANRLTYGFVLHPRFKENGYLFLVTVPDPANVAPEGTLLSRYKVVDGKADPASEQVILKWPSGGHNGGCMRFGPDGMLYVVTGDGSGIADELVTGQDVSDLLASMLRIDVDRVPAGKTYGIPADNPFVAMRGARPELYAYGLRQLWKFSFDRKGTCWGGEVGQDLWESIHIIQKGGNYGWSVLEGTHPFRPERPKGPSPFVAPIVEHSHVDFRSITGGYVYYGSRLPELEGAYIYGDYDTGRVWCLRYDAETKKVVEHRELTDTSLRIVEWAQDAQGEVYIVDHIGGQLHQLVKAPDVETDSEFPRLLSETGLFASTADLTPAEGLIPYSVNAELWSDGAIKERYLAIPGEGKIEFDAIEYPQPAPGAPRGWRFPDGTVAVKTFFLETEPGNPASRRRLETRILHFEQTPGTQEVGDQVWHGYTYIWNDAQTDAVLAPKNGLDREYEIKDASAAGGQRVQAWHFPSRAECSLCHTTPAKYVLGLNTLQLNKAHAYPDGKVENQLAAWERMGLFMKPLPKPPAELPRLADPADGKAPLAERARAYLHANCAHCHMKWGGGNAEFQLLATLDVKDLGIVGTRPQHGNFELSEPALLVPGEPARSMIHHRMTRTGLGRMPHIASTVVHGEAVKLIEAWIKSLK